MAYRDAIKCFRAGDIAVVTTPDDTHFDITMACIEAGLHVMVTKPLVKTLPQHLKIVEAAKKHNVLVCLEFHKRYDPIYNDAVNRIRGMGDFGFFQSYMSQPKYQLSTFKSWAGISSDISYYLNSHHIDIHEWAVAKFARPVSVSALGSTGVAKSLIGADTEDTITISAQWENIESGNKGVAVYTASWATPKTDVHSEQNFQYIGHKGQIKIDQAHRGVALSTDAEGHASINPLYMRYTPDHDGNFVGQACYGYQSFEVFVKAVNTIRAGSKSPPEFDSVLPTAQSTMLTTAILEAGRLSLDNGGVTFQIAYDEQGNPMVLGLSRSSQRQFAAFEL
jgi:D-galacturonate reductase